MSILEKVTRMLERSDGWVNQLTGFGTSRSRTAAAYFQADGRLDDESISAMYHHDDMAAKIVNIVPEEMLRLGFILDSEDKQAAERVRNRCRMLQLRSTFLDGMIWGRAYGGCVLWLGADDGQDPNLPLKEDRIKSLAFIGLYDRRRCNPGLYYNDPRNLKYGRPETYRLSGFNGGETHVHESRCIVFRGARTGDREQQQLQGWDYSVLQNCVGPLRQFHTNHQAAELLMTDASQSVFKMRGLLAALAAPGGMNNLATRATLIDQTRSIARSVMLDAEGGEEFTKVATSFAGVPDMLDRSANRLSAASGIPVTLLMGQAPAGLNATGASDIRVWYDGIKSRQDNELREDLERAVRLVAISEKVRVPVTVAFPSLWQETPLERSTRQKLVADTDAIYITNEVYTPEECAENRFMGEEWSSETKLEREAPELMTKPEPTSIEGTATASTTPRSLVTATATENIVKVNEARLAENLTPVSEEEGGNLWVSEHAAQIAARGQVVGEAEGKEETGQDVNPPKPPAPFGGAPPFGKAPPPVAPPVDAKGKPAPVVPPADGKPDGKA
jgi:phage-related protein (TIGR01555 family)